MTLPLQGPQPPAHDADWRRWSAKERQRLIGLPKAKLANVVTGKDFESLTDEDRKAVVTHLAAPNAPDPAHKLQTDASSRERRAPAKAGAPAQTHAAGGRRPLSLKGHGKKYGPQRSLRQRLYSAWPWVLPLLAVILWAVVLLIGCALIWQHSAVS